MTAVTERTEPAARRSHRSAWILVATTPVGLAVSGVCWLWLLDLLHVVTSHGGQSGAPVHVVGTLLALAGAGTIALAAPSVAVILATSAACEEGRTAHRVLVAAWLAFALSVMVFGVFGLLVWGPVLYARLRQRDPDETRPEALRR